VSGDLERQCRQKKKCWEHHGNKEV
jgi:hypothetical protein